MPFASIEDKRTYQREWVRKRREAFFQGKVCVDCKDTESLQLDHVDPKQKISHRIWSWSDERRLAELEKCVVRCLDCHLEKTLAEKSTWQPGSRNGQAKLTEAEALYIRESADPTVSLSEMFAISKTQVRRIRARKEWKILPS